MPQDYVFACRAHTGQAVLKESIHSSGGARASVTMAATTSTNGARSTMLTAKRSARRTQMMEAVVALVVVAGMGVAGLENTAASA